MGESDANFEERSKYEFYMIISPVRPLGANVFSGYMKISMA